MTRPCGHDSPARKGRCTECGGTSRYRVLNAVEDGYEATGIPLTVREIGVVVGLSSPSTVHTHLEALEAERLVERHGKHGWLPKHRWITVERGEEGLNVFDPYEGWGEDLFKLTEEILLHHGKETPESFTGIGIGQAERLHAAFGSPS